MQVAVFMACNLTVNAPESKRPRPRKMNEPETPPAAAPGKRAAVQSAGTARLQRRLRPSLPVRFWA